jgi:amino acid adenylation domain-containing protein
MYKYCGVRAAYSRTNTIADLIAAQSALSPNDVAVVSSSHRLTFFELDFRTNQLARYLQKLGVGPETLVGVSIPRSANMLVAIVGILKAGGAYVPLDPAHQLARIETVAKDARLRLLLTSDNVAPLLPRLEIPVISLDAESAAIAAEDGSAVRSAATVENLAYVIYTSGSTGQPKGVMVEHRNVLNFFAGIDRVLCSGEGPRGEGDSSSGSREYPERGVWLATTSMSFDISVLELLWTLARGFQVVIHGDDGPETIPSEILLHGVTHLQSVPSLIRALVVDSSSHPALSSLKKLLLGGEALSASLVEKLRPVVRGEMYNMYGPTETTIWSTSHRIEGPQGSGSAAASSPVSVPIGRPMANTQVYVLDSELNPVADGEAGELFVGGDGVVRGYWNRPELTAERFIPDPFVGYAAAAGLAAEAGRGAGAGRLYKTGDLVRRLPDGNLEFLGRNDFQVKIRGFRIELAEIEARLEQQPGVHQAVVVAREVQPGDQRLIAYIATGPEGSEQLPTAGMLHSALAAQLPDYMLPSHFVFLEALPLTANGKIDRQALPAASLPVAADGEDDSPLGELEQIIAQAWLEAFGLSRIGRTQNFFELGGHSLTALQIAFRVRQRFQIDFPMQAFVEYPSIGEQARQVEDRLIAQATPELLQQMVAEMEQGGAFRVVEIASSKAAAAGSGGR